MENIMRVLMVCHGNKNRSFKMLIESRIVGA